MKKELTEEEKKKQERKELIKKLLEENEIKTMKDISMFMKEAVGEMMQTLLDNEFDEHMGYKKGEHTDEVNNRNGKSSKKKIKTDNGEYEIEMPRDRDGSFKPIIIPKRKRILSDLDDIIIQMYAKGNSLKDIKELLKSIYGITVSEGFISESTKVVSEKVKEWKERQLKEMYAFVYMDCLYVPVKEKMISEEKAVYVALGIDMTGKKEILGFWIGESESSTFWLGILDNIKTRGVKDILFLSTDGVVGFKEALEDSYPKTKHQRCIVHIIRNLVKCVSKKEYKELCDDLKKIYKAINKETAKDEYKNMIEKWKKNKLLIKRLENNIEHLLGLFEYPEEIRQIIYTTNAIESVNSGLRKITNGKGSFINEEALEKVLYLRVLELSETWTRSKTRNWPLILNMLYEMFGERVEKYIEM